MNKTCNLCVHFKIDRKYMGNSKCTCKEHVSKGLHVFGGDHPGYSIVEMGEFNFNMKCLHWKRYVLPESWIKKVFRAIFKLKGVTK